MVAKRPVLKDPPAWVLERCDKLPMLPRKEMTQKEIEERWGADNVLYSECLARHDLLLNYYRKRDQALRDIAKQ